MLFINYNLRLINYHKMNLIYYYFAYLGYRSEIIGNSVKIALVVFYYFFLKQKLASKVDSFFSQKLEKV